MASVVMSSKYQVVVPKEIRERFGFQPGDRLAWFDSGRGLRIVKVRSAEELDGSLAHLELPDFEREKEHGPEDPA
jgi:AbrB family looped-hinge helix DNA binding protein